MRESRNIRDLVCCLNTQNSNGTLTYLLPEVGEMRDGYREISLKAMTKYFSIPTYRITSKMPKELVMDIEALHGVNTLEMLKNVMQNEAEQGVQKKVISKIQELGWFSFKNSWTPFQNKMNKWFEYIPKVNYKTPQDLCYKIILESRKIADKSRLRPADFVIVSSQVLSVIQESTLFEFIEDRFISTNPLIRQAGVIAGNISVFVDPLKRWDDPEILIGAKTNENELGIYLVEGESAIEEITRASVELKPETVYILNTRMDVIDTMKASDKYTAFEVTNKPHNILTHLWKKLIKK